MSNIFSVIYDKYKINKPIRLIELFAGIGAQAKALENLGVNFEHWKICEFDKYPVCSYNAIHHTNFLPSDITKIHAEDLEIKDTDKYEYIMTYSFPCQDLSIAGKRNGMNKGSQTRSSLLWEVERILNELKELNQLPQILLMENVPEVIGKRNIKDFEKWYYFLTNLGYSSYYKILNAKDFGIPQNRNRCFMISILGNYNYEFPSGFPLKLTLKDLLEENVDEKYYLSKKMIESFTYNCQKQKEKGNGFKFEPTSGEGIAKTITTLAGNRMDDNFLFVNKNLNETLEKNKDKLGNDVLSIEAYNKSVHKDISQTITTRVSDSNQHFLCEGVCIDDKYPGSREPRYYDNEVPTIDTRTQLKIVEKSSLIKENNKNAKLQQDLLQSEDGICRTMPAGTHGSTPHLLKTVVSEEPFICASRGRNPENPSDRTPGMSTRQRLEINSKGLANTLTTIQKDNYVVEPKVIKETNDIDVAIEYERFKESALKTFNDNECKEGDTIDAYNQRVNNTGISATITTRPEGFKTAILPVVKDEYLGTYNYNESDKFIGNRTRESFSKEYISTIRTNHSEGIIIGSTQKHASIKEDGVSPSLTSAMGMGGGQVPMHNYDLRIRKLTPKECWRLMGFDDIDFERARNSLNNTFYKGQDKSSSQLYKQAGNSIVVSVLENIFKELL